MKININEKLYDIVQKDNRLREILIDFGFKPLKNKVTYESIARVITLSQGLEKIGKSLEALNTYILEKEIDVVFVNDTDSLATLIKRLHEGEDTEQVKEAFMATFGSVRAADIIAMEQELVDGGMAVEEIQSLCDIHADIFNGSIEDIHATVKDMELPGHPVHVLKAENKALKDLLEAIRTLNEATSHVQNEEMRMVLLSQINELFDIDKHYTRKEQCFFPLLEKHGFTAPPQVMWGVDDEIRKELKEYYQSVRKSQFEKMVSLYDSLYKRMMDMIFKEEEIMLPMIIDVVTEDDWLQIAEDSQEIGYCIVSPKSKWIPQRKSFYERVKEDIDTRENTLNFKVGTLKFEELEAMLNILPVDVTFVDKDDTFKYFNQTKERVFYRSEAQIGRSVQHCHPPKSLAIVQAILDDFKSGKKGEENFWIEIKDSLIYISYYAIRDQFGNYMGTVEITQDIKPYQGIQGQKRLREE